MDLEFKLEVEGPEKSCDGFQEVEYFPEELSEEYIAELNEKVERFIDHLETCGDQNAVNFVRQLKNVLSKLRSELNTSQTTCTRIMDESEIIQSKLDEVNKITKNDKDTIQRLKKSLENSWKQVDAAHARELIVQEEVLRLKEKLENYKEVTKKSDSKKRDEVGDDFEKDTASIKEAILKQRNQLSAEVKDLSRRLEIQRIYTTEIETLSNTLEEKNKALYKLLDAASSEAYKEKKQAEHLMKDLFVAREEQMAIEMSRKELKDHNEKTVKNNVQLTIELLAFKARSKNIRLKYTSASSKLMKATTDLENLVIAQNNIQTDLNHKIHLLKLKEEENSKLRQDCGNLSKANERLVKKLISAQQAKSKVDGEVLRFKNQCNILEKELITLQKSMDNYSKRIADLMKERDSTKKDLLQAQRQIQFIREKFNIAAKENVSLKADVEKQILNEKMQKQQVTKAKNDAIQLAEKIEELEDKIDVLKTEIYLKADYIAEFKKTEAEANVKLASIQNLLEATRSEKNNLNKNLLAITREKCDLKEQLEITIKNEILLKNEIMAKDAEIIRLQHQCDRADKEKSRLRKEIQNCQVIWQINKSELQEKKAEIVNMYKTFEENETNLKKMKKAFEDEQYAKGLLGGQLSKRNEEITSLTDQLLTTKNELDRANSLYDLRLEDIRLLKIEIQNLRSEQEILRKDREHAAQSRRELLRLHRSLNQERVKARALQDEMLTPMNVHRWRSLGGKDPEKADLISKLQILQRRVLQKNIIAIDKDNTLREAHHLYFSLKEFMLKLPSYKVKEHLNEVKHDLQVKEKKMKALVAELNAKEIDDKTKDCILEDLRINLDTTRKELTREKKKKQKLLEERHIIAHMQMQCFPASAAFLKTAGSGYKMSLNG